MENDFDQMFRVTFTLHTDADPSNVLEQAIDMAKSLADSCDGEADEDDVSVTSIVTSQTKPPLLWTDIRS